MLVKRTAALTLFVPLVRGMEVGKPQALRQNLLIYGYVLELSSSCRQIWLTTGCMRSTNILEVSMYLFLEILVIQHQPQMICFNLTLCFSQNRASIRKPEVWAIQRWHMNPHSRAFIGCVSLSTRAITSPAPNRRPTLE